MATDEAAMRLFLSNPAYRSGWQMVSMVFNQAFRAYVDGLMRLVEPSPGKEANQLSEQIAFGLDPDAQLEFGTMSVTPGERIKSIAAAVKTLGASALAAQAHVSRVHLNDIVRGKARATGRMLEKLETAIAALQIESGGIQTDTSEVLERIRLAVGKTGLRAFAGTAGVSASQLSRVLAGERRCTHAMLRKVRLALAVAQPRTK